MKDYKEDADIRNEHIQARGIIVKDDKVLVMFRRKEGREYYTYPGGHMRVFEKPIDTAIREIREETTIEVKDLKPAFDFINYAKPEENYYFVGRWKSGEPTLSGEESRAVCEENYYEPMWVDISEIKDLNLYPRAAKEWTMNYLSTFF
jgi:8-oxo-dGTP pyrophosphatase MutT (NUDIX family)